jgi:cyclophilin family peptidyl-prolyl cis-trans isomerase
VGSFPVHEAPAKSAAANRVGLFEQISRCWSIVRQVHIFLAGFGVVILVAAGAWYFQRHGPTSQAPLAQPVATPAIPEDLSRSLLEQMHGSTGNAATTPTSVPSNAQLEESYRAVVDLQEQIDALKMDAADAERKADTETAAQKLKIVKGELSVLNERLLTVQNDLARAREVRPSDAVVQWLTGELLMLVGGEPENILPYFERAVSGGLNRSDVHIGLARVRLEANQFDAAYTSAVTALDMDRRNLRVWQTFGGIALANGRFQEILTRIDDAYPRAKPPAITRLRMQAKMLQDLWAKEEEQRRADEADGPLPRVRLTIEHRAFGRGPDGRALVTDVATGRDQVEIELFSRQAPATVANFLKLVESGFYNGTRFHWAEAASMVVGGDPNTKNDDPADDGTGGPGYVIPDEFRLPAARLHFRGSVAMVASAANTAGSQFFMELAAHPEMNHHLTVFGRVVNGQPGVDRITQGRTNMRFGRFGKAIPGDVLVSASVVGK